MRDQARAESSDEGEQGRPSTSGASKQAQSSGERTPHETPRMRSSKRKRPVPYADEDEMCKHERREPEGTHPSLLTVLNKLDAIASEGRVERAILASQSKADREYFQSALEGLRTSCEVLSDDDQGTAAPTGRKDAPTAASLANGTSTLQDLRDDTQSARASNDIIRWQGTEDSNKKLKSGFGQTINDNATVVAQWPQMNVYRSSKDTATYSSLSINEFCSGYLVYINDCLNVARPEVAWALDYISYLDDLLDEIPLVGWEGVRDAHGELLCQIEQGGLTCSNIPAHTKAIEKAIRKARILAELKKNSPSVTKKSQAQTNLGMNKCPCPKFQDNSCEFAATHKSDGTAWLQCGATCLRTRGQGYSHPKAICNQQKALEEKTSSKN